MPTANLCTDQNCSNSRCLQCSGTDKEVCTSCSKATGYEVLVGTNCKTPTEACDSNWVHNSRLTVCQQCQVSNCVQCSLTQDQVFQLCFSCDKDKWLYKGKCYARCPNGSQYSLNTNKDPNYVASCLDITCAD